METATREAGPVGEEEAIEQIANILDPTEKATEETTEELPEVEIEETEEAKEVEEAETEPDPEESDKEPSFESVEQLAEATGMDQDKFLESVKLGVKFDGKEETLSLKEVRDGYQRLQDYKLKTSETAEERRQLKTEREALRNSYNEKLQQADAIIQTNEKTLVEEFESVDWVELESADPGQAALLRQKYQERYAEILNAKNNIQAEAQKISSESQLEAQEQYKKIATEEMNLFFNKVPEWNNEAVREAENKQMVEYLSELGFSKQEISGTVDNAGGLVKPGIIDHRFYMMAVDASKYRASLQNIQAAKEKSKGVPKLLKPGARKSKTQQKQTNRQQLLTKVKTENSEDAALALLRDQM